MQVRERYHFQFADGLRGLAALQVLFLHYASVYLPLYAHEGTVSHFAVERWLAESPFFALIDGGTAVCLFFVISGFVLASSFENMTVGVGAAALKRSIRLLLPVLIAAVFSYICLGLVPAPLGELRDITHSDFAARIYLQPITFLSIMRDGFINALFLGYEPVSLFSGRSWLILPGLDQSIDPPFWTLHVEFWGSMLVLALVYLNRRLSPIALAAVVIVALWLVGTSWYLLFVVGFLLYLIKDVVVPRTTWFISGVGSALVIWGGIIGVTKASGQVQALFLALTPFVRGQALNAYTFQSSVGGALIFAGVWLSPHLRVLLSCRPVVALGRLSFGLYLLHFPVLFALSSRVFLWLLPHGYGMAISGASVAGMGITVGLAFLYDRFVDGYVLQFSREVATLIASTRGKRQRIDSP